MHLVCPSCFAVNRVPDDRISANPKCGKCSSPVLPAAPIELTQANFAKFLQHNDLPVVVDFWAPWCGPCKMFAPVFTQAAAAMSSQVRFVKVNTEVEQFLAQQYQIRSIPTLALFRNGQEVDRMSGALGLDQLRAWITRR